MPGMPPLSEKSPCSFTQFPVRIEFIEWYGPYLNRGEESNLLIL